MFTHLFRIGRDAEVRKLADGESVCNLALAYNYGPKKDGKQASQWVDATLWGKRAESLAQYLTKGTSIVASLSDVHVRTFKKNDGTEGATLAGKILDLHFAGSPPQKAEPKPQPKPAQARDDFSDESIPF